MAKDVPVRLVLAFEQPKNWIEQWKRSESAAGSEYLTIVLETEISQSLVSEQHRAWQCLQNTSIVIKKIENLPPQVGRMMWFVAS